MMYCRVCGRSREHRRHQAPFGLPLDAFDRMHMNHAFSLYVGNPNPRFEMVFYDQRGVEGELASLSSWIHDTEAGGYVLIAVEYVSPQANLVETRKRVSELGHEYMIMLNEGCYQPSHYTWLVTPRIY